MYPIPQRPNPSPAGPQGWRYVCGTARQLRRCGMMWEVGDIDLVRSDVRYWRQSRHSPTTWQCPLMTQSGHRQAEIAVPQN